MRTGLRYAVAGRLGGLVLDGLFRTTSIEFIGGEHYRRFYEGREPCLLILWHGRLLPAAYYHRNHGLVALVSRSADGEYITRVLEHWRYRTIRGSSSRGGSSAYREILRHAKAGRMITLTPDGPRGPRQKLKPGALAAAQRTGLPIVPVASGADRAWWFESWDRFLVPRPFARIRIAYGEPVTIARDADPDTVRTTVRSLEADLNRLVELVDAFGAD